MSPHLKILTFHVSTLLLLFGTACTQSQESRTRIVKIGLSHPPSHSFTQAFSKFKEMFEESTSGRYNVRIYHSSQLGGEREMQEMLTLGSLEITVTGVLNIYEPLFAVFELPYLYRDREHVMQVMNGPEIASVADSLTPMGLRMVGFYENGFRNITNSVRPIHRPEDLQGLIIRTPENPAQLETFRALGAIPTPMSFSELYTALAQGVVHGQENPLQNIWTASLCDVQDHLAVTHHIYNAAYVLVSERFWQSIPPADRTLLQRAIRESTLWQLDCMEKLDVELEQKLKDKGMQFTYPDMTVFEEAARPAYDALCGRLGVRAHDIVKAIRKTK